MKIEFRKIKEKQLWENFLIRQKDQCNFLHSWNWGEMHLLLNHKIFRLGFYEKDQLTGLCLLIKQEAARGNYLECPGGPIINWHKKDHFKAFVSLIKNIGRQENCLFIRVRPQVPQNINNQQKFKGLGFIKSPMHLHAQDTWVLDITKDESLILKGMRKTTRYLIRKAVKDGVKIVKSINLEDINILYKLQKETAKRHNFIPFSLNFFKAHFQAFIKDKEIIIFKAVWQKKIHSCAMIIFYQERAVYHYSASSSTLSKIPVSYLLQWEAIKEAKKRKCQIYDFWGIAPENSPKNHRFAGVTLFKKGFGGYGASYLPAQDLPLKWNYWLTYIFETIRRRWRHL